MTVLGELYYAVYASQHKEKNLARLKAFLNSVILWEYDRPAAEEFGRNELPRRKRTVYQEPLQEARPKGRGMNPCRGFKRSKRPKGNPFPQAMLRLLL